MVTANVDAGMERRQAVEKAVDDAIKENLLEDFFRLNRAEVIGMCMTEFDEELAIHTWREDGRTEKAIEAAKTMLADNLSPEKVSLYSGLQLEKVLELQKEITVHA